MINYRIFLAGSVQKQFDGLSSGKTYWRDKDEEYLRNNLNFSVDVFNPNTISIDRNDAEGRFREDIMMLLMSDLVLIDLGTKKGIGVGSEMMLAKIKKIPVFAICPENSHYRKELEKEGEWIHPFVFELSDKIFDSIMDVVNYLNELHTVNGLKHINEIDELDIIDQINGFDAGYDEGYIAVDKFWGDKPASLVQKAAGLLKNRSNHIMCLDLGCGHGKNAIFLANNGFKVFAWDSSYYSIKEARTLNKDVIWKVRDMRKFKPQPQQFDLIVLTGSLHCLSTRDDVIQVVNNVKTSTKYGGYNVISVFNDRDQDLSGHSIDFHPLLLSHNEYIDMYRDWKVVDCSDTILKDEHPHNSIVHYHSITRILVQRV